MALSGFSSLSASPSMLTALMIAGLITRAMKSSGTEVYSIQSMFSPKSSSLTALIRTPLTPTVAPTGSTCGCVEISAIFARSPGIRAAFSIKTTLSAISGTSSAKRPSKNLGEVRESSICMPLALSMLTRRTTARTTSPTAKISPLIRLFIGSTARTSSISM